ncbi:MAG: hypothetical protein ACOYWZ_08750 [Bacillota bacterium]
MSKMKTKKKGSLYQEIIAGLVLWLFSFTIVEGVTIGQPVITSSGNYLGISELQGHSVYYNKFSTAQTGLLVIDPGVGMLIRVIYIVASCGSSGDILVYFGADTNAKPIFELNNTLTSGVAQGQPSWISGTVNDNVYLTCPADTTISIYYDEK